LPSLEEHAKRSRVLYGDSAEEIHEYIDSAYEVYGGRHRKIRHDTQITPTEVERIFGKKHEYAKDIAIDHVMFDAMDSCCKIGEVRSRAFLIRFVKNHFENVPCAACKNPSSEIFADVYVYVDWRERLRYKGGRSLPFIDLLFAQKEREFSNRLEKWACVYYCYKCHRLSINLIKDDDAACVLKRDPLSIELMNRILLTLRATLSNAVGRAYITQTDCWLMGVPENTNRLLKTETEKKVAEEKITKTREVVASKPYRVLAFIIGLFWLMLGIFIGTSSRIAPKIFQWNYILAWIIVFGLPCLTLFWFSLHKRSTK